MALDDGEIQKTDQTKNQPGDVNTLIPGEELILNVSDCVENLVYEDGSSAPDEEFHYSIRFKFANKADSDAVRNHPNSEEIANSIIAYMREHGNESLALELQRDQLTDVYPGETGYKSFTSGTVGDLNIVVEEMIPIINETYGLAIQNGEVSSRSQQVQGCNPSPWILPEDLADNKGFETDPPSEEATLSILEP